MIINTVVHQKEKEVTLEDLKNSPLGKHWVINNDIDVSGEGNVLSKISIEFVKGKFIGNGLLVFNDVTLIANENKCIIDYSVNFSGKITNHKVYTDWFGLVPNNKNLNYSEKINQIINLIYVGTIYFPKGGFYIGSSIYQKYGVNLEGYRASLSGELQGTCFFLHENPSQLIISSKCFILLNTHSSNPNQNDGWIVKYPSKETCVKNIHFYNSYHKKDEKYRGYRAILAAGKFLVESCHFDGIDLAVCTNHSVYMDGKTIHDCIYWTYGLLNEHSDLPAFDLSGLGDSLSFIRNHANSDLVLKISMCMGGIVQNNILHGGIEIDGCKSLRIDSNHMERLNSKTLMRINSSQVVVSNNYMWKESIPNIVIGDKGDSNPNISESIVSLENNNFLYYESEDASKVDIGCEYDIQLSPKATLSIKDCYRYTTFRNIVGALHPCGIKIESTTSNSNIYKFNDRSHLYSKRCTIAKNHTINDVISYTLAPLSVISFQTNTGIKWREQSGIYDYTIEVFVDRQRKLKGTLSFTKSNINITEETGGVLMKFQDGGLNYPQGMMLYIKRTFKNNSQQIHRYCLVPVLSLFIYDNGYNINGFPYTPDPIDISVFTNSITYKGDNVEAVLHKLVEGNNWNTGDMVIYNTSIPLAMSIRKNGIWKHF